MLTHEQREQFLAEGHIVIKGAFPREDSLRWVHEECARAGYDVDDPQTWRKGYERMDLTRHEPLADYAPAAWEASCDLMGGDRPGQEPARHLAVRHELQAGGGPAVSAALRPVAGAGTRTAGISGTSWTARSRGFWASRCSPTFCPQGGATFLAVDSVPVIARYLAAHPEGVGPDDFDTEGSAGRVP